MLNNRKSPMRLILTLLLIGILSAWRGGPGDAIRRGNDLYARGNYAAALQQYREASRIAPENGIAHYNRGNALYQQRDYQAAADAYLAAVNSPEVDAADAYYNLGNAAFRRGDIERAIMAYKNALRLHPDDVQAKRNLEFALRKQQEQQQKEQEQGKSGEDSQQQSADKQSADEPPQSPDEQQEQDKQQEQNTPPDEQKSADAQPQLQEQQTQSMDKQDLERLLESVRQQERRLQQYLMYRRLRQQPRVRLEKDW